MWLYDPRTNVLKEMTGRAIAAICGIDPSAVSKVCKAGRKLKRINCYVFSEKPTVSERKELYRKEVIPEEEWRVYRNSDYFVSNFGRVKRVYKTKTDFLLPYPKDIHKCMMIKLILDGAPRKEYRVRELVAELFLKDVPGCTCVTHKTIDYTDCSVRNLKRVSRSEIARLVARSLRKPVVLVDPETLTAIDSWSSLKDAGKHNHFSRQSISSRCSGLTKRRDEGWFMLESSYEEMIASREMHLDEAGG